MNLINPNLLRYEARINLIKVRVLGKSIPKKDGQASTVLPPSPQPPSLAIINNNNKQTKHKGKKLQLQFQPNPLTPPSLPSPFSPLSCSATVS